VLTIASLPKPFIGHIGVIQRNAIGTWLQLKPRPEIILFGNEEGTAEVAKEFGITHIKETECNEYGIPYLSGVFKKAQEHAKSDIICYSNCDIILLQNLMDALEKATKFPQFLLVAECQNLDVKKPIVFSDVNWREQLIDFMKEKGKRRVNASDFFAFRSGMFPNPPPLVLGRAYFDNWIIYEARRMGAPVIDATGDITAIHQNHYYAAVPGETEKSHNGFEAQYNLKVLGRNQVYWMYDATYRLHNGRIRKLLFTATPLKERWKRIRRWVKYNVGI
jgi:hypothetical protein